MSKLKERMERFYGLGQQRNSEVSTEHSEVSSMMPLWYGCSHYRNFKVYYKGKYLFSVKRHGDKYKVAEYTVYFDGLRWIIYYTTGGLYVMRRTLQDAIEFIASCKLRVPEWEVEGKLECMRDEGDTTEWKEGEGVGKHE
jgi:hypothetical protein